MKDDNMNTLNLKEALQYLKEYYLTVKMHTLPVMGGLDNLNDVIIKLQNDLRLHEENYENKK